MDNDFVRKRITSLRIQKGVSEYKMSLDLGHSKSYIQSISSGRALPSLPELFYICDYFGITIQDFFDEELDYPQMTQELIQLTRNMDSVDVELLITMARRLRGEAESR